MSPRNSDSTDRFSAAEGWLGAAAVVASMIFWTLFAAIPVDLAWSTTAGAAHLRA